MPPKRTEDTPNRMASATRHDTSTGPALHTVSHVASVSRRPPFLLPKYPPPPPPRIVPRNTPRTRTQNTHKTHTLIMKVYTGSAGGRWWSSSDEFLWLYAPGNVPCLRCLRLSLDDLDPLLECLDPPERFDRWEPGLLVDIRPARRRSREGVALPRNVEKRDLPGVSSCLFFVSFFFFFVC